MNRKQIACFLLFELEEKGSMPLPSLALACIFAVLAPEAGFGEKDFLVDSLENLADDGVKPLIANPKSSPLFLDHSGFLHGCEQNRQLHVQA